jgi:hypothetical protein
MTLDMIAITRPAGAVAAACSISSYGSAPRLRAEAMRSAQNASRNHRMLMPQ